MTSYFIIYDTIHLWQNYSVDECGSRNEAFQKLKETCGKNGWRGWVAMELGPENEIEIPAERLDILNQYRKDKSNG